MKCDCSKILEDIKTKYYEDRKSIYSLFSPTLSDLSIISNSINYSKNLLNKLAFHKHEDDNYKILKEVKRLTSFKIVDQTTIFANFGCVFMGKKAGECISDVLKSRYKDFEISIC